MDFANYWFSSGSNTPPGPDPGLIGNSLRFRGNQWLTWTPSQALNGQRWTVSFWVKRGKSTTWSALLLATNNTYSEIYWNPDDNTAHGSGLAFSTGTLPQILSVVNNKARDRAGWYHIHWTWDTPQANQALRSRYWVNGVEYPHSRFLYNGAQPGQNASSNTMSQAWLRRIGSQNGNTNSNFDGFIADWHQTDGTVLPPERFGQFNDDGVWCPIETNLTQAEYGTGGYHLDFSDPANIGADRSGNGNNWTPTGFELTNSSSIWYDWSRDTPTNNHPVWNPHASYDWPNALTTTDGGSNLITSNGVSMNTTISTHPGDRLYAEFVVSNTYGNDSTMLAVVDSGWRVNNRGAGPWDTSDSLSVTYYNGGGVYINNSVVNNVASYGNGDVIGIAFNHDTREVQFFKNNVSQGTWTAPDNQGRPWIFNGSDGGGTNCSKFIPTQARFNPPAGFEPISTSVLSDVPFPDPRVGFQTILDSGANILANAQATFPQGLWWIKSRTNDNQHQFVDSNRGTQALLNPNQSIATYSAPAGSAIAWCWPLLADRSNGFDMVNYQGTGNAHAVSHNLGATPELIFVFNRDRGQNRAVYHTSLGNTSCLLLDSGNAKQTAAYYWNNTSPTATNFTVGTWNGVNGDGEQHTAYLWRSIPGLCSIGRYIGTGNNNGPFVELGFTPSFLWVKHTDRNGCSWISVSSATDSFNPNEQHLRPSATSKELTYFKFEICAGGFKIRNSPGDFNGVEVNDNGVSFCYAAWAIHPFGGGNVNPATAR